MAEFEFSDKRGPGITTRPVCTAVEDKFCLQISVHYDRQVMPLGQFGAGMFATNLREAQSGPYIRLLYEINHEARTSTAHQSSEPCKALTDSGEADKSILRMQPFPATFSDALF
jgi:hypothetical protein